jgi:hypothetical protein
MPYKLRKARGKDLYYVITKDTGKKHSNEPLPLERAKAQMKALYASMDGSGIFDDIKDKGMAVLTRTNYVGPFNRLDDEYIRTHPPVDIIDEGAMKHDIEYSRIAKMREDGASPETIERLIRESDERFLKNIRDNYKVNPLASALGYAGIKGKNVAEDKYGLDKNLFVGKGRAIKVLVGARKKYKFPMKGAGFFGDLWDSAKRAVSSTVDAVKTRVSDTVSSIRNVLAGKAPRERLPPSVRRLLAEIGDKPIVELYVRREPIQSALNSALNIISFGAWNSVRQKYQYDKFFHLRLECTIQVSNQDNLTRKYILEKNAVIELTVASDPTSDTEMIAVPLDVGITLNGLLEGAKRWLGTDFYKYDPFFQNCQDFVMALLRGNGLGNEEVFKFIKQPIDELIQEVPSWTGKIARALTDAGGVVDTIMYGQGKSKPMPKFAKQLEALGIKPVDYLAMAQKNAHKAGLAYNMLSFSTDDKHKLQIPNADGKIIRFGASGLKDYLIYSMTRDAKADQRRSNYRKRAMKIKGDWAKDPYSPNSLAISVLWS